LIIHKYEITTEIPASIQIANELENTLSKLPLEDGYSTLETADKIYEHLDF